jgi:uncharacterized protein (TIGR02466 family)
VTDADSIIQRAETHLAEGRPAAAFALTAPLAAAKDATHPALATHATILKALRRPEEALVFNRRATERFAGSGVAWHNLAATLGDLGQGQEARTAVERALRLGLDGPQTWSVYARALLAVGNLDAADAAYRECVRRAPLAADVAIEYANLLWMRTGDVASAQAPLDAAFHAGSPPGPLLAAKARLIEAAGDAEGAAQFLAKAVARVPDDVPLRLAAAQAALEAGHVGQALQIAEAAAARGPGRIDVLNQLAIVLLGAGRADDALAAARRGLAISPDDRSLTGWAATAARALGDPLYEQLYEYDRMIGVYDISAPDGWASVPDFLADLSAVLQRMHPYGRHPFHQSLRHGSQTLQPLTSSSDPVMAGFFQAIDGPIREHMAWLGQGTDPLRRLNTGDYRIEAAWSVLLRPGGFHKDHFHPQGWLSSAFYVETPNRALEGDDHAGWIRFGQPPIPLDPPMPAARHIEPRPGRLILFPSYMWHGTVPFTTEERRLTMAFDVVPA